LIINRFSRLAFYLFIDNLTLPKHLFIDFCVLDIVTIIDKLII